MIRIFLLVASIFLFGCVTTVTTYTQTPRGYTSDVQKNQMVRRNIGSVQKLNRHEVLFGTSLDVAHIACAKLHSEGYWDMVCRQRFEYGILVVRAVRHSKLQAHLNDPRRVFRLVLQPSGYLGLSAPLLVDFERGYYETIYRYQPNRYVVIKVHMTGIITPPHRH